MFDIEEVSRIQVFISSRHFCIQACGANGDCGMRVRRLAFVHGERASDIGKAPLHGHLRHKHQAHARGELDDRCLWIDLPGRDVRCRNLVTVIGCGHCYWFSFTLLVPPHEEQAQYCGEEIKIYSWYSVQQNVDETHGT